MRRSVVHSGEESPPAPLLQRGEEFHDALNQAFPPLKKGGQGGFSNAGHSIEASHAP